MKLFSEDWKCILSENLNNVSQKTGEVVGTGVLFY